MTTEDLRVVTRYAVECAEDVLPIFEDPHPHDRRPRAAIDAARAFVGGAARSRLQRVTSLDAHRAAKEATIEAAVHSARAAGDAAAAAYLHPPGAVWEWTSIRARTSQVGHILRPAAHAARATELAAGRDPATGDLYIERARLRATPALADIVRRYPPPPDGVNRVARLMTALDTALRTR
ncbi:putative immunity protein [Pseudonocardia sp. C8]|uniref:putative immunity protein n=1 Tax=Pseudonocardia sp. C8 TaxID=2762759 RepID=UPI001C92EB55|nr:exonuclease SbcC [Pseudonocardia sp. C8]